MRTEKINSIEELDLSSIKLEDLHYYYTTGQAFLTSKIGEPKKYGFRSGVMTELGDIEKSVWIKTAETIIRRDGEWHIQEKLREVYSTTPWGKDLLWPLGAHCLRLYEKEDWAFYEEYQKIAARDAE